MYIQKLNIETNANLVNEDLKTILNINPWPMKNQIGLKHRVGAENIWIDAEGGYFDKKIMVESDYTNWSIDNNFYVRQEIEKLEKILQIKTGRIRFMKLPPKLGLTVHNDTEVRYHLVLKTNLKAHFGFVTEPITTENCDLPIVGSVFHIPKDNFWYKVDTRKIHWVFNGGTEDRIHLVVCECPKK